MSDFNSLFEAIFGNTANEVKIFFSEVNAAEVAKPEPINNKKLLETSGVRVVHTQGMFGGRRVTVAYKQPFGPGGVIEISTAIANPHDVFSKKEGTKLAVERFLAGKTITVPDNDRIGAVATIRTMFV